MSNNRSVEKRNINFILPVKYKNIKRIVIDTDFNLLLKENPNPTIDIIGVGTYEGEEKLLKNIFIDTVSNTLIIRLKANYEKANVLLAVEIPPIQLDLISIKYLNNIEYYGMFYSDEIRAKRIKKK